MRRHAGISDTSNAFELFLDTLTNTFGGVVFITLLVCILLQIHGTPQDRVSDQNAVRARALQADLARVRAAITRLESLAHRMDRQIEKETTRLNPALAGQYNALLEEQHSLEARIKTLDDERSLHKQTLTELESQLADLKQRREELERQVSRLENELEDARPATVHTVRLPQYHRTEKRQIALVVAFQRIYWPYVYDGGGNPVRKNAADFEISEGLLLDTVMTPKPGHGTAVEDIETFEAEMRRILRQFHPDTAYIHLAVWPDSYRQAEIVRDLVIDLGFNYGLILMDSDSNLVMSRHAERGVM